MERQLVLDKQGQPGQYTELDPAKIGHSEKTLLNFTTEPVTTESSRFFGVVLGQNVGYGLESSNKQLTKLILALQWLKYKFHHHPGCKKAIAMVDDLPKVPVVVVMFELRVEECDGVT